MDLFIFGSTGDLIKRKVLPALEEIGRDKSGYPNSPKIGDFEGNYSLKITALGRRDWDTKKYIEFACPGASDEFKKNINYKLIDFDKRLIFPDYKEHLQKNKTAYFYLSLPPKLQTKALAFLGLLKKQGYSIKILLEKPFGDSLNSAKDLKKVLELNGLEKDFLISDHYLFKQEALNLKSRAFTKLKIVSIESVGLEGRTTFYNDVGATKDMIQSHLINITAKLIPIKDLFSAELQKFYVAQYGNGKNEGYVKELGKPSGTETFVHVIFRTKSGKEIEFITGKGFSKKESFIEIDGIKYDLEKGKNPYIQLFKSFLDGSSKHFPTISQSIQAWGIIEKLGKQKAKLNYYKQGAKLEELEKLEVEL